MDSRLPIWASQTGFSRGNDKQERKIIKKKGKEYRMEEQKKIYQNVSLGANPDIGSWVELGLPPRGQHPGDFSLVIGDNATIRSHTIIYAATKIGNNFSTGHGARIQPFVSIGDNVSIGSGTEIEHHVTIGNNVRIHSNCFIAQGTVIRDGVRISPNAAITSTKHPLLPEELKNRRGPEIGENVYIGIGVTILSHLTIGKGSLIGSGSVVTKDVPEGVVMIGTPARVHMTVEDYLKKLREEGYYEI